MRAYWLIDVSNGARRGGWGGGGGSSWAAWVITACRCCLLSLACRGSTRARGNLSSSSRGVALPSSSTFSIHAQPFFLHLVAVPERHRGIAVVSQWSTKSVETGAATITGSASPRSALCGFGGGGGLSSVGHWRSAAGLSWKDCIDADETCPRPRLPPPARNTANAEFLLCDDVEEIWYLVTRERASATEPFAVEVGRCRARRITFPRSAAGRRAARIGCSHCVVRFVVVFSSLVEHPVLLRSTRVYFAFDDLIQFSCCLVGLG